MQRASIEFYRLTALAAILLSLAPARAQVSSAVAQGLAASQGDIERIEHLGKYFDECTLAGETRADGVVPRHATCIQVARRRWVVLYSTHGYRGVDDERSIVYQLRRDAPDGPLVREGFLSQAVDDWRPAGLTPPDGFRYFKQHGHMTAFGVPQGALIGGRPAPHANLFMAKWRTLGRPLETARNYLHKTPPESELQRRTRYVECVQFRLNEAQDDLEVVQGVRMLRQRGYETGERFCSLDAQWMNQSFCPAVPYAADCSEWVDCNHFDGGRLAVLKYRFNPLAQRYEWVQTGPLIGSQEASLSEASLVRLSDGWLLAARTAGRIAWGRAADPLGAWSTPSLRSDVHVAAPLTVFRCPDGVPRLFTGDPQVSPHRNGRDPLYMWDLLPDSGGARIGQRRVIYDSVAAGLPLRRESRPKIDFCELFPHFGRTQLVVHGVSTRAYDHPYEKRDDIPAMTPADKAASGLYYARITYRREPPPLWEFAD